jgi:hypothetical protein
MPPIIKPQIWLHPEIYEFIQPENSALITGTTNSHHDEDSVKFKIIPIFITILFNKHELNIHLMNKNIKRNIQFNLKSYFFFHFS